MNSNHTCCKLHRVIVTGSLLLCSMPLHAPETKQIDTKSDGISCKSVRQVADAHLSSQRLSTFMYNRLRFKPRGIILREATNIVGPTSLFWSTFVISSSMKSKAEECVTEFPVRATNKPFTICVQRQIGGQLVEYDYGAEIDC